jgi:hypothetical protein
MADLEVGQLRKVAHDLSSKCLGHTMKVLAQTKDGKRKKIWHLQCQDCLRHGEMNEWAINQYTVAVEDLVKEG